MHNIPVSASELKRNAARILNEVYFGRKIAIIERHGKAIAKLIPFETDNTKPKNTTSILDKYFGALPDFPNVVEQRSFRKRSIKL